METLQRTANRGSVSTGYDIDNSCKFEADNSESMSRTPSGNGNLKTCTLSVWLKRTELKDGFYFTGDYGGSANPWFILGFNSNEISLSTTAGVSANGAIRTSRLFRDTSAWYHIVVAFDTTQSTASNRVKIYVNGVQETSFSSENYPSQNDDLDIMAAKAQGIGGYNDGVNYFYSGYMSEFVGIDGQALAPTEFGEVDSDTGIWIPKDVSGLTFGTNGFYLDFKDASNLGNDASGGTDFTETNIASADQATDTPTNNFATFNVAQPRASGTTITKGGTDFYINSNYQTAVSSIAVTTGKWYAEFSPDSHSTFVGFVDVEDAYVPQNHTGYYLGYAGGNQNRSVGMKGTDGAIYNDNNSASGATFGASDIISLALDMDNRKAYWAVNGTYVNSGDPANGTNGVTWATSSTLGDAWTDVITMGVTGYSNIHWKCNFGGYTDISISSAASDGNGYGTFEYAPPSGYYAICSKNLAEFG